MRRLVRRSSGEGREPAPGAPCGDDRPTVPTPVGLGRDTRRRAAAREALVRVIWDARGERRLPRERELVDALEECDPRDAWWTCEMSSAGPVYLLPTREWIRELVKLLRSLDARVVLEAGAGDGFLARCLASAAPALDVFACDDASWEKPRARMSATERRLYRDVPVAGLAPGPEVERLDALRAVRKHRPDVVIVSWAPPGRLVERLIRSPVRHVIDIGTDGDTCGMGERTWRFEKEFLEGPIERRALCRFDARPREQRHAHVTLYYGRAHERHAVTRSDLRR